MDEQMVTMASMVNSLNALSALKRERFKENPKPPLRISVVHKNAIVALNRTLEQLREEQLRNNPIIANLFNTSTSKKPRQCQNSI